MPRTAVGASEQPHRHELGRIYVPSAAHAKSRDSSPRYLLMMKCQVAGCAYRYAYDVAHIPPTSEQAEPSVGERSAA